MSERGIELADVYLGAGGILTGSARSRQEARELAEAVSRRRELQGQEQVYKQRRAALEAEVTRLKTELEVCDAEIEQIRQGFREHEVKLAEEEERIRLKRWADTDKMGQSRRKRGRPKKQR
jgi:circadian clock protein KaiC